MSNEYTPTTEQVRDGYATTIYGDDSVQFDRYAAGRVEFDRWLKDHDKTIQNAALEEARTAIIDLHGDEWHNENSADYAYRRAIKAIDRLLSEQEQGAK